MLVAAMIRMSLPNDRREADIPLPPPGRAVGGLG
jgi:hypothetical protein